MEPLARVAAVIFGLCLIMLIPGAALVTLAVLKLRPKYQAWRASKRLKPPVTLKVIPGGKKR
jgi:hypothetical protein